MSAANGSIKLLGYSSDREDGVVFAVLKPVLAGNVITFTSEELGLGSSAASWAWTAGSNLPAGAKVSLRGLSTGEPSSDTGSVAKSGGDLETTGSTGSGSGSSTNPDFLAGSISENSVAPARTAGAVSGSSGSEASASGATPFKVSAGAPAASSKASAAAAPNAAAQPPVYGDGDEELNNSDILVGGVAMRGGNDRLTNSGTIVASETVAVDMGDGNDVVRLEDGSRIFGSIVLGNGDDQLSAADVGDDLTVDAGAGNDTVVSGSGDDLIQGGAGDDTLDGGEGDDALQGGDGNDRLVGGSGDDLLFGGNGNDTLVGGEGNDLLDGGAGIDTVDYSAEIDDLTVDLGTGRASGGDAGTDTLTGIENAFGGSGDDILIGNAEANRLEGRDGDDRLVVAAGDTALGGAGDDVIEVRTGAGSVAAIDGGADEDTVELTGTGTGTLGATTNVENLVVKSGSWSVAGSAAYDSIAIENGGTVTSGIVINNDDQVSIASGGRLTVANDAVTWGGGGNAVLTNAGLIESARVLQTATGATGTLTIDNLAGGTLRGALTPSQAGAADAAITLNNAGTIEAAGRVMDFRSFDANGGQATINNLVGGIIRQTGNDTDVLRPGQDGTVNNRGTITTAPGLVGGGDLIDFQEDTGGRVNNFFGGLMEASRHVVTGDRAVTVVNDGTMIGRNGSAVNIDNEGTEADRVFVTNNATGVMQGRSAALTNSDGDAIDVDGLVRLFNYGTIEGLGANGANDGEPNVSEGIAAGGGDILNYGAASKIYGYGRAIQVDNSGNQSALGATFVNNDGLIQGDGNGPEGVSPEAAAAFDLRGNEAINLVGDFADEILNQSSGRIVGGVSMGGGDDRMNNSGRITATGGSAIDMGAGNDILNLYVGATVEGEIRLGSGNDRVTGDQFLGGFEVDAGDGDDQATLGNGNDTVRGGLGNDTIFTGAGNDEIEGGDGNDNLNGEAGNDLINGGAGNDTIAGGAGDDTIDGGAGDDVIKAGLGNDTVDGGDGFDTLDLSAATGPLFVDQASGRVSGNGIGVQTFTSIENVAFGDGNNVVTGGNGDDNFDGGAGDDVLSGGAGDDVLLGNVGNDTANGGSGDDQLDGGIGNDTLSGGSGDDIVLGGAGNDTIKAGSGDDEIEGGAGDDQLEGGSGSDMFSFAAGFGRDSISDFGRSDDDTISFEDDLFADFGAVIAASAQVGNDVVITANDANALTLRDTDLATLSADDFRFS